MKKNFFYNALLTTSNLIFPLITFPYVNRVLDPEGIGKASFATSFVQAFMIICSLGVPYYGIREIAKTKSDIEKRSLLVLELTIIKIIVSLFALVIYFALVFNVPTLKSSLIFFLFGSLSILIGIFDFNYFFSALENFRYITVRSVFFQIVSVVLTFSLIKDQHDVLLFFLIPIIITFFNTIVNIAYLKNFLIFPKISLVGLRKHVLPLITMFSIILFSSLYNVLDTTILGFLTDDGTVGYYSTATKLNKIPIAIIMTLAPVLLPRMAAEVGKRNFQEVSRLANKAIEVILLIGVPITFGILCTSSLLIFIFAGEKFVDAILTLQLMSPLALIIGVTTCFSTQILVPFGNEKLVLRAVLFGMILSLGLNFYLIPYISQNGAAISALCTELLVLVMCYWYSKKLMKINMPYQLFLTNVIVCIPFFGISYLVKQNIETDILSFILIAGSCVLYYLTIHLFVLKTQIFWTLINAAMAKIKMILKYEN
ncbi:flippase [Niabella insulamsoli]|uniref:flippase n=1 Tax=Niabella insulamsoli TaxID=3144874 RepID=UPI0031FC4F75